MIAVNLKGGLGNMLFQIAAGISFSKKINSDVTFPNLMNHLFYLNCDNCHNPKLDHSYEYLNLNLIKKLKTSPFHSKNIYHYPFHFIEQIPLDNSVIDGFFQSEKYFLDCRELILDLFHSDFEIKNYIISKYGQIFEDSTSIHVRRGDYLNYPDIHTVKSQEYFQQAISILKNKCSKFIIQSDDIPWCKSVFIGDEFIFIENEKDYIELHMMSMCKNNIISNSSFSWWGAWINNNTNKIVIAPKKWFGDQNNQYLEKDIIPDEWIKL
jgi:hypothetical protein